MEEAELNLAVADVVIHGVVDQRDAVLDVGRRGVAAEQRRDGRNADLQWHLDHSASWEGKYRYAVALDTVAASAASATVGVLPAATRSPAAVSNARRVRSF